MMTPRDPQVDVADGAEQPAAHKAVRRRQGPPAPWARAVLVTLSAAGVLVPAGLWSLGHGHLAARVFSGDVLLLLVLVLIL